MSWLVKIIYFSVISSSFLFSSTKSLTPKETNLYKTWSNVYLIDMGNAIANHDFEAFAFYMSEYESNLKLEHKRRIKIEPNLDIKRYGDTDNIFYTQMVMHMVSLKYQQAYFNFVCYLKLMQNRFLYNMDYKPIPDYAK
jgi:hypothetical protein